MLIRLYLPSFFLAIPTSFIACFRITVLASFGTIAVVEMMNGKLVSVMATDMGVTFGSVMVVRLD